MWRIPLVAAAVAATVMLVAAAGAGARTSSSLSLVVVGSSQTAAAAQPRFGSSVTFDLQTSSAQPWVSVTCSQGGVAVYGQYWGFWSGYDPGAVTTTTAVGGVFTLGPTPLWSSGPASCTATLYTVSKTHKQTTLATLDFTVAA